MKKFEPTLEHAFYALAIAITLGLRFLHLGALPLSDAEADWALQALQVAGGLQPAVGPNPVYVHLTAVLFYLFDATNFLARFWPALAGSAIVLAPWFLRGRLGRVPAIILAFGLAIDPGLVAMSHLAGGPMPAVTCAGFAILMWLDGRRALTGLFAGLALLAGPSLWFGLLGLILARVFGAGIGRKPPAGAEEKDGGGQPVPGRVRPALADMRATLLWALGTLLVAGSLLALSPKGLPAFFASFLIFLRGWWTLSDVPLRHLLLALPAYELLPLAFGIAGVVRGILKREVMSIRLGIWALLALALALVYPGKQTGDLIWAVLPLWALAALELGRHFDFENINHWELAGVVILVTALVVFGWLDLASVTNMDLSTDFARTRLLLLIAVVFLILLSLLLVGTGWSARTARLGGVWSAVLALTVYTVAAATGAGGIREPRTAELWQPEPRTGRVDVLLKVANQISDQNTGYAGQLPLTISGMDSPALRWAFRGWQVDEVTALAPGATPELVITPLTDLSMAADYRGEGLILRETVAWDQALGVEWLKWFVYRQMPLQSEQVILWVRSDLMLDSQGLPSLTP